MSPLCLRPYRSKGDIAYSINLCYNETNERRGKMFTQYFVRGTIEINGIGGIFRNKPISEQINYSRSYFLNADEEDVLQIANKDLLHQIEKMNSQFHRYFSKTKFKVSLNYPDGFLRRNDEHQSHTKSYSRIFSIRIVAPISITNSRSIMTMTVREAMDKLTVNQWKQLIEE